MNAQGNFCKNWTQIKLVEVPSQGKIPKDINALLKEHLANVLIENHKRFDVVEAYYHNKQCWFQHSKIEVEGETIDAMHLYIVWEEKILCLAQFFEGNNHDLHKYMMFDFLIGMRSKGKELFTIQEAFDYVQPDFDDYETRSELELSN